MREAEKEGKKFRIEFRSYSARARKFRKKIAKKFNKLKNHIPPLFLAKMGLDTPRKREKNFVPNFVHTQPGQENSVKNSKKIQQMKNPVSGIIFSQNGMRYAEKEGINFRPKFRSYSARGRKFRKK